MRINKSKIFTWGVSSNGVFTFDVVTLADIKTTFKQWLETCPVAEYQQIKWVYENVGEKLLDVYTVDFAIKREDGSEQMELWERKSPSF